MIPCLALVLLILSRYLSFCRHSFCSNVTEYLALGEKHQNTELFLVRIFPHLDGIQRDTSYLSVFSPNTGKYGPEITPHFDTFHAVFMDRLIIFFALFLDQSQYHNLHITHCHIETPISGYW